MCQSKIYCLTPAVSRYDIRRSLKCFIKDGKGGYRPRASMRH